MCVCVCVCVRDYRECGRDMKRQGSCREVCEVGCIYIIAVCVCVCVCVCVRECVFICGYLLGRSVVKNNF